MRIIVRFLVISNPSRTHAKHAQVIELTLELLYQNVGLNREIAYFTCAKSKLLIVDEIIVTSI